VKRISIAPKWHWLGFACGLIATLAGEAAVLVLASGRGSGLDLEVSGALTTGRTNGFVTREQLLSLPLQTVTNALDGALKRSAVYRGVRLSELKAALPVEPTADVIFGVCQDGYAAHVDGGYIQAFDPLLILEIDGKGPEAWGRSLASGMTMAPFYINTAAFRPRPEQRAGGIEEGPVYPYAVVRLDFAMDSRALQPLRLGAGASAEAKEGERLAVRDCLSCHDHRGVGGTMSNRPWELLKTWSANTNYFRRYVVKPRSVQPTSRMPGFPHYNERALDALSAYFREWKPGLRAGDGEAGR
jgi:mono/diheme cytochrome c family protein